MDDIISEIKSDLSTAIGSAIKTYYYGEVVLVPRSYLPALMIYGNSTTLVAKSTAKDQTVHEITIRVVYDIAPRFDEDGTGVTMLAHQDLIKIMEERDANMIPKSTTVLGVLRRNISGTDYLFNNDIRINYKTLQQGEFFYIAAECTISAVTNLVLRS